MDENMQLLAQYLVDADAIARHNGSKYGLCDSIDNHGQVYQSAGLHSWLELFKLQGIRPVLSIKDISKQEPPFSSTLSLVK